MTILECKLGTMVIDVNSLSGRLGNIVGLGKNVSGEIVALVAFAETYSSPILMHPGNLMIALDTNFTGSNG